MEALSNDKLQSGLECLVAVSNHHRIPTSTQKIFREHLPSQKRSLRTTEILLQAANSLGLSSRRVRLGWKQLCELDRAYPVIARLKNGNYVTVLGLKHGESGALVAIFDPLLKPENIIIWLDQSNFEKSWSGELVLLKREYSILDEQQPFGFRWFAPEIIRQWKLFGDVALAAMVLHLVALAVPIFMQLVIDKVLVHQSYSTLYVLTSGVLIAILFEAILSYLKQTFLLSASNRIDIRLAKRTFSHLLRLPITYFETGSAGVTTQHMQQGEKIRQFLTGRLFSTILDASVLVVFIPVLFFYSTTLTLILLSFTAVIAAVIFGLVPTFRGRLHALYRAQGDRQAMLVETVQGMRTVKSMAMEPIRRRQWEEQSAHVVDLHFRVGKISLTATTITGLLEKSLLIAIIAVGAHDVFNQTLTAGALIAFQMLSGRVVSPLVQIVSLVHEFQEASLSVKMLGEIMTKPAEGQRESAGLEPDIKGKIEFEGVTLRYAPNLPPAIDRLSFNLPAGMVLGVVGRSGSGKTTLTRMLQGLYQPQEGVIRVDGVDLREIDLDHLRRNTGVVLQDNFLFRGTVRQNIASCQPNASLAAIAEAAHIAGADEFIERMAQGYETLIEENGANLSGGQKQRLSIARALLTKPRILILDEAASALDPESESIFLRNLGKISAGRTVIIISHRLTTLVNSGAIMVLDGGRIVDAGKHTELLKRCTIYQALWRQQTHSL